MDEETAVVESAATETEASQEQQTEQVAQTEQVQQQQQEATAEVEVTIDGVAPPQVEEEPQHIRELRQRYRDQAKRIKELEARDGGGGGKSNPADPGPEPTLDDPEINYDAEKFKAALFAWRDKKATVEAAERQHQESAQKQQQAWQEVQDTYKTRKGSFGVKDFDDAEEEIKTRFSVEQQGVMLYVQDGKAEVTVYALGKNTKEADRLAAIKDPLKLAFELGRLDTKLKVTPRTPPKPETKPQGNATVGGSTDKELERLEEEATRTGDRTKVIEYKRSLKAKS